VRVLVAGAHGKTARRLVRMLAEDGHEVTGLVRKEEQTGDVEADCAEPVVVDLEAEEVGGGIGRAVEGCEAIVFAAGAGPGSGAERKETMDYGGAAKLVEAAEERGVRRYLMLSSMGADDPEGGSEASARLCPIYSRGYSHCGSREGHGFESLRSPSHTGFFRLAESPSLTLRRHVQETHGLTEGLDRVAHSGITREQCPSLGFNVLIGSREPDTALVDAQRDRTGRGVLVEPVAFLHDQQYYVQAPALAQRDGVPTPSPERLLLAQPGNLRAEVERLQRLVHRPLGLRVRSARHLLLLSVDDAILLPVP
jgi:putative NADH-flavin reductase